MFKIVALSLLTIILTAAKAQIISKIDPVKATETARKIWKNMGHSDANTIEVRFDAEEKIASFDSRSGRITIAPYIVALIEKKFGNDAQDVLAMIIAHELRHREQGKGGLGFAAETNPNETEIEQDADFQGLLAAHLAGYEAVKYYDRLIEILPIDSKIKENRKQNNDKLAGRLKQFVDDYDLACYYTLIGEKSSLDAAKAKFEKLENSINELGKDNHFIIRPLKYQQGLIDLILALKAADIKYVFPVELIGNNFLNPKRGKTFQEPNIAAALKHLDDAEKHFNTVSITDDYFEINLGRATIGVIREILGKQTKEVTDKQLNSLLQKAKENKHRQQHDLLKAIVKYHRNKEVELLNFLEKSGNIDIKGYASANLSVINDAGVNLNQVNYFSQLDDLEGVTNSNFKTIKAENMSKDKVGPYVSYYIHEYDNSSEPRVAWNDIVLSGGGITMGAGQFRYFKTDSDKYHIIFVVSGETDNTAVITKIIRIFKN